MIKLKIVSINCSCQSLKGSCNTKTDKVICLSCGSLISNNINDLIQSQKEKAEQYKVFNRPAQKTESQISISNFLEKLRKGKETVKEIIFTPLPNLNQSKLKRKQFRGTFYQIPNEIKQLKIVTKGYVKPINDNIQCSICKSLNSCNCKPY